MLIGSNALVLSNALLLVLSNRIECASPASPANALVQRIQRIRRQLVEFDHSTTTTVRIALLSAVRAANARAANAQMLNLIALLMR
jgi:hypothetical protein